ncbi:hypothetical protein BKA70DRAFT_1328877 [Coprinopsis sp. MPI-PUGE-AT-0042]|nr:hypothetical protein BKA70DRAFT_1328877 [Coprinopsis sp. MPI-PUGE-AT-0042]
MTSPKKPFGKQGWTPLMPMSPALIYYSYGFHAQNRQTLCCNLCSMPESKLGDGSEHLRGLGHVRSIPGSSPHQLARPFSHPPLIGGDACPPHPSPPKTPPVHQGHPSSHRLFSAFLSFQGKKVTWKVSFPQVEIHWQAIKPGLSRGWGVGQGVRLARSAFCYWVFLAQPRGWEGGHMGRTVEGRFALADDVEVAAGGGVDEQFDDLFVLQMGCKFVSSDLGRDASCRLPSVS